MGSDGSKNYGESFSGSNALDGRVEVAVLRVPEFNKLKVCGVF